MKSQSPKAGGRRTSAILWSPWQEGGDGRLVRVISGESTWVFGQSIGPIGRSRWDPRGAQLGTVD